MTDNQPIEYLDPHERWYRELLRRHRREAQQLARALLAAATPDKNGCLVTPTAAPRKVRFEGQQDRAYRFVYCITNEVALNWSEVVRHRCNNRLCINPAHLTMGTRADNLLDDRGFRANGGG